MKKIQRISVIGLGTMGSGIAFLFASAGFTVFLHDHRDINGKLRRIERISEKEHAKGRLSAEDKDRLMSRVIPLNGPLDPRFQEADLVIETVREDLDTKLNTLREVEKYCRDDAIIASNTSSLSIQELSAALTYPDRFLGTHFFNPPFRMQLVEVVPSSLTSSEVLRSVSEFLIGIGKIPIQAKDTPGFIVNRLIITMINEAAFLLSEGAATKEDIDQAMRLGANHPVGPLELADWVGIDVCVAILESFSKRLGPGHVACPLLYDMVKEGRLGRKVGKGFYTYSA